MPSNTVRTHALETLFSKFSLQFQIISNTVTMLALETINVFIFLWSSESFQIVSERMLYRHCFQGFLSSFKYRLNACFRDIVLFFLQFEIVSNTVKMHDLKTLFSKCSKVLALPSFYSYYSMSHDGNMYVCLFYLKNVI
mgnify:CR=1 FL=1